MRRLICAFVVRIWHKHVFLMMWLKQNKQYESTPDTPKMTNGLVQFEGMEQFTRQKGITFLPSVTHSFQMSRLLILSSDPAPTYQGYWRTVTGSLSPGKPLQENTIVWKLLINFAKYRANYWPHIRLLGKSIYFIYNRPCDLLKLFVQKCIGSTSCRVTGTIQWPNNSMTNFSKMFLL